MKEIKLNMKENYKYEIIKKLVDTDGNKLRAAKKLKLSTRTINRLVKKYKERGKSAFQHGNHGKMPATTLDPSLSSYIILLYNNKYQGFNHTHFKELLEERENITISYTALRNLLIKNNMYSPRIRKVTRKNIKKKEVENRKENINQTKEDIDIIVSREIALEDAHPRQEKPKYFGEIIEMDGSIHEWFGGYKTTLHLAIDKCTNPIVGGFFDKHETLYGYYNVFKQILSNYGIPVQFNTDNRTVFNYEKLNESKRTSEKDVLTQFGYACKTLGVSIETSSVAQSKGLIERTNGTFQDRFINEMRIDGITNIDDANKYLQEIFIPRFNKRFSLDYTKFQSVMEAKPTEEFINYTLAVMTPRVVDSGSSIKYMNNYYQIYENDFLKCFNKGQKCLVIKAFDNQLFVSVEEKLYELRLLNKHKLVSDFDIEVIDTPKKKNKYIPPMSHPWKHSSFVAHQEKTKNSRTYTEY